MGHFLGGPSFGTNNGFRDIQRRMWRNMIDMTLNDL